MGGTPLPPFTDFFFSEKGVTDLGGTPAPPFTDKIRKVVFEGLPYGANNFATPLAINNKDGVSTCGNVGVLCGKMLPGLREPFKYYFADFFRKGGGGYPPNP